MADPAGAIAAVLRAAAAPESGYATQQVAHATVVAELRRLGLDSGTARVLADRSQATGMAVSTPLSPAMGRAHGKAPTTRAAYLVAAAHRLTGKTGLARLDQQTRERRYLAQHVLAQTQREQSAIRLDAATAAYGPQVGWHAVLDDRTTPTCRAMHGHNFDPAHPPPAGLPGISHVGCRCKAGLPHARREAAPSEIAAAKGVDVDAIDLATSSRSLDRSPRENWVEKAGGLPRGIRKVARKLKKKYPHWSLSRCIATAISMSKKWAAGGSAKGARNTAQWTALKARNAAMANDAAGIELASHHASGAASIRDSALTRRIRGAVRALRLSAEGGEALHPAIIGLASYQCGTSRCHLPGT